MQKHYYFLFFLSLLAILFIATLSVSAERTFKVCAMADTHIGNPSGLYQLQLALKDMRDNMTWDVAFVLGDLIHEGWLPVANAQYLQFIENITLYSEKNMSYYFLIPGDHEPDIQGGADFTGYLSHSEFDPTSRWIPYRGIIGDDSEPLNYTLQFYNLNFTITVGDVDSGGDPPEVSKERAMWINSSLENGSNGGNIVVFGNHWGGVLGDPPMDYDPTTKWIVNEPWIKGVLENWADIFLYGHHHTYASEISCYVENDVYYQDVSAIIHAAAENRVSHSFLFTFTNGSSVVNVTCRNHSWGSNSAPEIASKWDTWNTSGTERLWFEFDTGVVFDMGNDPPPTQNESSLIPPNNSIGVDPSILNISLIVNDSYSNRLNWSIELDNGNSSYGDNQTNGTIICYVNFTECTNYIWWVNITDGEWWTNRTYTFKTNCCPIQLNETPTNLSTLVSISTSNLSIEIYDDGNTMNWTIECNNSVSASANDVTNGTISCDFLADLCLNTTYYWWVNVTDGLCWSNETYNFTTENTTTINIRIKASMGTTTASSFSVIFIMGIVLMISAMLVVTKIVYETIL